MVVLHNVTVGTPVFYYCICDLPNAVHKQVQPIFMLFVAMSSVVCACFKAMSLVRPQLS